MFSTESHPPTRGTAPLDRRALLYLGAGLVRSGWVPSVGAQTAGIPDYVADESRLEHIFALPASSWNSWIGGLERRIQELMKQHSVPGASIALIRDAKIYWRRGFGIRDADTRQPVDPATIFEAASMSKPVFAYVVMKLAEQGVLDLDTPLTKYTSSRYVPDDRQLDQITARHVLMHAAGFPNWRSKEGPMIRFAPGTQFAYSGEGYSYLQSVITHLQGNEDRSDCRGFEANVQFCATDYADYMKARLLRPFGMDSSRYLWDDLLEKKMARPHGERGEPQAFRKTKVYGVSRYGSAGALKTTPTDYAKFMIEVMRPRPADAFRLTKKSRDEMVRTQIAVRDFTGYSVSWALGWRVVRAGQHELINHGGSNPGYQCFAAMSLARQSGFVIMTNADSGEKLLEALTPTALGS